MCKFFSTEFIPYYGSWFLKKFEKIWSYNKNVQGTFRKDGEDIRQVTHVGTVEGF